MEFGILESKTPQMNDMYQKMLEDFVDQRILVFNDEVDDCVLENYILFILRWNQEDNKTGIPYKKRLPIKIYINSPGGDLFAGSMMLDVITQSKTPIIGIAFGLVGSMAYHVYLACHERIAFKNSVFCQHEGDVAVSNSASKAKDTMEFFTQMDERLNQHILNRTKMEPEYLASKAKNEYFMYADEAKELGIVDKIIGTDCTLNYII